ncbi:MAG: hypothetical protein QNJ46_35825 [Leptolyngbyaceae cyanobacterium MO_188.B28]|nr:hypothetical protein [Leptolyngbyaceae cyanobacterium MO_188.B28]
MTQFRSTPLLLISGPISVRSQRWVLRSAIADLVVWVKRSCV